MTRLRVSAVSLAVEFGALEENLAAIGDALASDEPGPHLIVLPELATSGYVFVDADEARSLALRADDARLLELAGRLSPQTVAVVGFCEVDGDRLFNSALVIGADGILARYRKAHLWAAENLVFDVGDEAGAVVDTPVGRVGVAICYDSEFPELPRRLALAGAEVLAMPVNWPLVERPAGEHPPETVQAMASARSSRLPTAIADRHGGERDVEWTGATCVISSDGWVCATADADGVASTVLDLDKSLGVHNDLFADRRPELYADLASPIHPTVKRGIHV
ncbi:nitrilase-related carbon-nitrogen hydrolase [Mycolicibacterium sediminis]|uniref:Carbon-nitrogen hydrolase n=1 Tax=Mycolicibacterium sediminis TaxID=1286180 RepID=A0A7I7R026_9MYCO|nr:nitrilase-related carbon-nitrogen hydrolase [Mycolicibacterium sediminis]BBY31862.1 carbon-nitrogen hydrolase [Mycolicibacterium sediminis]